MGFFRKTWEIFTGRHFVYDSTEKRFINQIIKIIQKYSLLVSVKEKRMVLPKIKWQEFLDLKYNIQNWNHDKLDAIQDLLLLEISVRKMFADWVVMIHMNDLQDIITEGKKFTGSTKHPTELIGNIDNEITIFIKNKMEPLFADIQGELKSASASKQYKDSMITFYNRYLEPRYLTETTKPQALGYVNQIRQLNLEVSALLDKELNNFNLKQKNSRKSG